MLKIRALIFLVTSTAVVGACSTDRSPASVDGVVAASSGSASRSLATSILPYGLPIAISDTLRSLPAPYDLTVHGPAPHASDWVEHRRPPSSPSSGSKRIYPLPAFSDGNAGFYFLTGRGLYAAVDPGRSIYISPSGSVKPLLYAPTHLPFGGSCIEVVTIHQRVSGKPNNALGFWDWCMGLRGDWGKPQQSLDDAGFRNKYIRSYTDEFGRTREVYLVSIFADNPTAPNFTYDTWHALLYNFSLGVWEEAFTSQGDAHQLRDAGLNGLGLGWSMWESFNIWPTGCPGFVSVTAGNLQVRDGLTWRIPDETIASPFASGYFPMCGYTHIYPYGFQSWWALTPLM